MNIKPSSAVRGALRGLAWLTVLGVILSISAYSLFYVARHLGVPRIFAAGMSTAYDGVALLAADKSLQYAQDGRSGVAPRLVTIAFVGLSAWLNALHSILGHESPLAVPMWAGLPVGAAVVFELHTSQARAKALARIGKRYPSPLPSWGGVTWLLFPLETYHKLRDYVSSRTFGLSLAQVQFLKVERKDRKRRGIHAPDGGVRNPVTGVAPVVSGAVTGPAGASVTGPVADSVTGPVTGPVTAGASASGPDVTAPAPAAQPGAPSVAAVPADGNAVTDPVASVTRMDTHVAGHHVTDKVTRPVTEAGTRNCEHCDQPFYPATPQARFCNVNCRVAAHRARQRNGAAL